MAAEFNGAEIPNWLVTILTGAATGLGGFVLAFLNRGPAMQAVLDSKVRALFEAYEGRIEDLLREVHSLREEVVALRKALDAANRPPPNGFGA